MTREEFYSDLCNYYFTTPKKAAVRIKFLDKVIANRVEYSEKVIERITAECHYFPSVNDINRIFQARAKELPPIGGSNGMD